MTPVRNCARLGAGWAEVVRERLAVLSGPGGRERADSWRFRQRRGTLLKVAHAVWSRATWISRTPTPRPRMVVWPQHAGAGSNVEA